MVKKGVSKIVPKKFKKIKIEKIRLKAWRWRLSHFGNIPKGGVAIYRHKKTLKVIPSAYGSLKPKISGRTDSLESCKFNKSLNIRVAEIVAKTNGNSNSKAIIYGRRSNHPNANAVMEIKFDSVDSNKFWFLKKEGATKGNISIRIKRPP